MRNFLLQNKCHQYDLYVLLFSECKSLVLLPKCWKLLFFYFLTNCMFSALIPPNEANVVAGSFKIPFDNKLCCASVLGRQTNWRYLNIGICEDITHQWKRHSPEQNNSSVTWTNQKTGRLKKLLKNTSRDASKVYSWSIIKDKTC